MGDDTPKPFKIPAKFPGETVVYIAYGPKNRLLYVGIADNFYKRMAQHAAGSRWWMTVERFEVEPYPTRHKAMVREAYLIKHRHPIYNEQHQDAENLKRVRTFKEKFTGAACKHCGAHHLPEGEDVCSDCKRVGTPEYEAHTREIDAIRARNLNRFDTHTMSQVAALRKAKAARRAS